MSAVGVVASLVLVGAACSASGERPDDARTTEIMSASEPPLPIFTMEDGDFTDEYGRPDVRAIRLDGPGRAHAGFGGYATEEVPDGQREPLQWWPSVAAEGSSPDGFAPVRSVKRPQHRRYGRKTAAARQTNLA